MLLRSIGGEDDIGLFVCHLALAVRPFMGQTAREDSGYRLVCVGPGQEPNCWFSHVKTPFVFQVLLASCIGSVNMEEPEHPIQLSGQNINNILGELLYNLIITISFMSIEAEYVISEIVL